MNAKTRNESYRLLFLNGGALSMLWARAEMNRKFDEMRKDEAASRKAWQAAARNTVAECPCGCGLKDGICDAQADRVRLANDELPF